MVKRIFRQGRRGIGISFTAFMMCAALFSGCSHEDDFTNDGDPVAVNFTAGIEVVARTIGGGDEWTTTDRVGIFMLTTGGNITTESERLADNMQYNAVPDSPASATAAFVPANKENTIYYPQRGTVDFIAYYPHGAVTNGKYNVTVVGQTSEAEQNARDVLYAPTTNATKSQTAVVNFQFGHVLSKVTLNVTLGIGFTEGGNVTAVTFSGMPASATLDLQDGSLSAGAAGNFDALKATKATGSADATFSALLIPQPQDDRATSTGLPDYNSRTAVFTVDGETYTWTIPENRDFAAGKHYTYSVTVNKTGVKVDIPAITEWKTPPQPRHGRRGTTATTGRNGQNLGRHVPDGQPG